MIKSYFIIIFNLSYRNIVIVNTRAVLQRNVQYVDCILNVFRCNLTAWPGGGAIVLLSSRDVAR